MTERRRQYGTGSVFQRSSDGLWIGTLRVGYNANGRPRTVNVSAHTKAEANRKLKAKATEIARHGVTAASGSRTTLKTYADQWLTQVTHTFRPQTYNAARTAIGNINASIGHRRLTDLTPNDIRAFHHAMAAKQLAAASQRRYHQVLMSILKAAMLDGHTVPPNVLLVRSPGLGESDRQAMTTPDAIKVLNLAVDRNDGPRWAVALLEGVRQGEALGLTWDAYDPDARTLDISWQLQRLRYLDPNNRTAGFRVPDGFVSRQIHGSAHLVRPKTEAGRRIIPVVSVVADALDAWRETAPASPHGLIFPRTNGLPKKPDEDRTEWHALQAAAGVAHPAGRPYHGHETRHTTISLLVELGVDRSVITAIVGQVKLVESYVHTRHTVMAEALEAVAARLRPA